MKLLRALSKHPLAITGLVILLGFLVVTMLAPLLTPHDPLQQHLRARLLPPFWLPGGTLEYPLGTDQLGRDLLSRIIQGSRVAVLVAFGATTLVILVGTTVGLLSGFFGGLLDTATMRVVDVIISVPDIILYLTIIALAGPSLTLVIVVIGLVGWTTLARVVRSEVLTLRRREYVEAARALGQAELTSAFRQVLPNVLGTVVAIATLKASSVIIAESTLSYLGFGVQPPTITWGQLLAQGQQYVATAWWLSTFPGLAITLLSLSLIFLGNWLRDLFDPRSNG
ncbi:MAG: ABC transporter permease [Trueperaceae bacterium]